MCEFFIIDSDRLGCRLDCALSGLSDECGRTNFALPSCYSSTIFRMSEEKYKKMLVKTEFEAKINWRNLRKIIMNSLKW